MAKQTFTTGQVLTAAQMTSLQQTAMGGGSATAKTASYVLVAADAGTTVIMNSASSTTITVNTSLFSAGDTVLIQNIGTGTTTITAGTATVSTAGSLALTQYEGGLLYFTAAGTSIFYDYVQAAASTSALVFIKKVDFSAASSVDFSDSFSATYVNYLMIGNYTGTADSDLTYRYRVSGADNSTSNYNLQIFDADGTNVTGGRSTGQTVGRIGPTSASASRISNTTYFIAPFLAQTKGSQSNNMRTTSTAITQNILTNGFNAATSFTGFTLIPASGTVTGTFAVYGYTNA